jgi:hypothetical protein
MTTVGNINSASSPASVHFGRQAKTKEYEGIQNLLKSVSEKDENLKPLSEIADHLDPKLTRLSKESRIPIWNFFRHVLPNMFGRMRQRVQILRKPEDDPKPFGARLTRFSSEKRADRYMAAWDMNNKFWEKRGHAPSSDILIRMTGKRVLEILI